MWFLLPKFCRYATGTTHIFHLGLKTSSKVKVTMTRKLYATLPHPRMYSHIKFGIPTSKVIGDMHWTRSGTDGQTDGRKNSVITICLPKFLWGHKKHHFNTLRVKFKNGTKVMLVTFSTIFFLPFHLAIGCQRCPKNLD